jgi:ligand-binding SRPBCC domain-containing protein
MRVVAPGIARYVPFVHKGAARMLAKSVPSQAIDLHAASTLKAPRAEVWRWITSVAGISDEMRPYWRITAPIGVQGLADVNIKLGSPFSHSHVYLFGFIPLGSWDMTLSELELERGFVEQSPSTFMKSWRHERRIHDVPDDPSAVQLVDHVTFTPKFGAFLVGPFLQRLFEHRHRVLRSRFGQAGDAPVLCRLSVGAL